MDDYFVKKYFLCIATLINALRFNVCRRLFKNKLNMYFILILTNWYFIMIKFTNSISS